MAGLERDTIGGFNAFLDMQNRMEGETYLTTVLFDDMYEMLWNGVDAKQVKLTENEYYVRGCTALLDAMGKTILAVGRRISDAAAEKKPDHVIFVITTDGMENASKEFTHAKVKELIRYQQEKYGWDFIFMGANMDSVKEADSIGIQTDHAFNYDTTKEGVGVMYETVSGLVSASRMK
ncbi:hypothetical protein [Virgibacillus siamensis]|uniref:hypothetical protein n=1 Tax=Virgibacillus siamensis TaxID=480071 RepID=UPI0009860204|nr:hypothetical protein [Virgibacillus siamensis]